MSLNSHIALRIMLKSELMYQRYSLIHDFSALVDTKGDATLSLGGLQSFSQRFAFINHLGLGFCYGKVE